MKKLINFIEGLFLDKPDAPSMKRLIALYLSINLANALYKTTPISETLVISITTLIGVLLGIKAIEKIMEVYYSKK
jgi:hypothetical protein